MLSRRDVIVSFLGAAALQSCRRRAAPPEVPGVLVDRIHEIGHLLRQGELPRASEDTAKLDCLVVGAGAAGLSAAWRLRGAGLDSLLVVEVDDVLGGTAQSGKNERSAFPWGAHYLPAPLTNEGPVPRLLRELGVVTGVDETGAPTFAEEVLIHEPEERVFFKGHWYEGLYVRAGASAEDLAQLHRFEAVTGALAAARDGQGRKAFAVPIETGSDDAEWTQLDRLSMADWLTREGFTSPRLTWLVDYACRDDYGATAQHVSAWAGLWYFCARQTGEEKNDGYLSWPEGNGKLIAQLAKSVGAERLRKNVLIHTVEETSGGWHAHGIDAKTRAPVRYFARQVVLSTPRHVAGRILSAWRTARPKFLDAFVSGPWVVANLTLSEKPKGRGFPLAWDNVLYDSKSLGYVMASHQSMRASAVGPAVATWYYPLADGDVAAERKRLLGTTYEDWRAIILADLLPAHFGLEQQLERIEVMRWGHAMVRPVPGLIWGEARREAQVPLGQGSLHFAHSDLGGLALFEEANWHGVRAAEAVLAGLGQTSPSWL
ncbi:MAG: NAD(P)-binding protein [Archangium sp.]|nr:NAD(P)-binding protein [Archangium sp.]